MLVGKFFKHFCQLHWPGLGLFAVILGSTGMYSIMTRQEVPVQAHAKPAKMKENRWYIQAMSDGPAIWRACVEGDLYVIVREMTWESQPIMTNPRGVAMSPNHPRCRED